jgi:hypothetical protein
MKYTYNGYNYEGTYDEIVGRVIEYMLNQRLTAYHQQSGGLSIFRLGPEESHISDLAFSQTDSFKMELEVKQALTAKAIAKIPKPVVTRPDLDLIQVCLFSDGAYKEEVDF